VLLTDRFVYVHEPKTGGSFVTYVMTEVHGGLADVRGRRIIHPALRRRLPTASFYLDRLGSSRPAPEAGRAAYGILYRWNDHGTCREIPRTFRSRQILATVRNPFETYVSEYLFGWWKRPEYVPQYQQKVPDFSRRYASFPDITFAEYLTLLHAAWALPESRDLHGPGGTGYLTERFVRFYFRAGDARDPGDMYPVRFLRTARLNEDLHHFLLETGYDPEAVEFVRSLDHVLPVGGAEVGFADRAASHDWASRYTPELREIVRTKDRLIFDLFPEFDVPLQPAR
jgi:hypothetical protein